MRVEMHCLCHFKPMLNRHKYNITVIKLEIFLQSLYRMINNNKWRQNNYTGQQPKIETKNYLKCYLFNEVTL